MFRVKQDSSGQREAADFLHSSEQSISPVIHLLRWCYMRTMNWHLQFVLCIDMPNSISDTICINVFIFIFFTYLPCTSFGLFLFPLLAHHRINAHWYPDLFSQTCYLFLIKILKYISPMQHYVMIQSTVQVFDSRWGHSR